MRKTKESESNKKDPSQAYFWTEEWQRGERQADADIKAGRVKTFESAAEAVKYLESKQANTG